MPAVAVIHRELVLERVASGAMLKSIAVELNVTPGAISNALCRDPEYIAAREIGAEVRLEEQYEAIVSASEQTAISRAREGFRAAAWFAEREFPHRWGQHTQVTVSTGDLGERLRRARERVIEPDQSQCSIEDKGG